MYLTPTISLPIPSAYVLADDGSDQRSPLPVLRVALLAERALGVGGESSSTSNVVPLPSMPTMEVTGTEATTSAPFFPTASATLNNENGSNDNGPGNLTKTVLEWVFAIAALVVIASLTIWRYAKLRRNRQPLHAFLPHGGSAWSGYPSRPHSVPRTTGLPRVTTSGEPGALSMSAALFYPPSLSNGRYPATMEPLPAVIASATGANDRGRGRRAARGTDIDAHGRRTGARDVDDGDGGDDKDELPAYDNVGGPPKYIDLESQAEMQVLGIGGASIPLRVFRARLPTAQENPTQPHPQAVTPGSVTPEGTSQAQEELTNVQVHHDHPPPFSSPVPTRPSSPSNSNVPQLQPHQPRTDVTNAQPPPSSPNLQTNRELQHSNTQPSFTTNYFAV